MASPTGIQFVNIVTNQYKAIEDAMTSALTGTISPSLAAALQAFIQSVPRQTLTGNINYYVAKTGSDLNNGTSPSNPFLTIGKATATAASLDCLTYNVGINVAAGVYTENVILPNMLGSGVFSFNCAGVASTIITSLASANNSTWTINGFKMSGGTVYLLQVGFGSTVTYNGVIEFGDATTDQIWVRGGGIFQPINQSQTYNISGGALRHWRTDEPGAGIQLFGNTIVISNTPNFSSVFAYAAYCTAHIVGSMTFSGTGATGTRYLVVNNAIIAGNGGGAAYLPGNVPGTADAASGGIYT